MAALTFVVGACADALALAALARSARAHGHLVRVVHLGHRSATAAVTALGLPEPDVWLDVQSGPERPARALARLLADGGVPDLVLAHGHGSAAMAACLWADAREVAFAHADAGVRDHGATAAERRRRLLDHGAALRLCAADEQVLQLLHERLPPATTIAVGSLSAVSVAALPARRPDTAPAGAYLYACLEHTKAGTALDQDLAGAAAALGLPCQLDHGGAREPREQLEWLRHARVLATDSHGWQELAAALGIACVTVADATGRPETIAGHANRLAGTTRTGIDQALAAALAAPAARSPYGEPTTDRALRALGQLLAAPVPAPAPTAAVALPSDGDASGRLLGAAECEVVGRAIRSGTLNSTKGTFVTAFERAFAARSGRRHAVACASGSAAVHVAIAALQLRAGDEVITTPITDMGALTPICFEGGVPVFADVDPRTLNVTVDTLARQRTDRTRAVIVTHLFGRACDMTPILAWAKDQQLPVIEDCAQAFLAEDRGRPVGSFGAIATFSLQQGKHMTTGEGGIVTTDDPALARRMFLAVNKAWGYGDPAPDHYFPALNYRMTELQGAIALPQLDKLAFVVQRRRDVAAALSQRLHGIPGLQLPDDPPGGRHSWWKYAFTVDAGRIAGGAVELGKRMRARGIACVPRYIQKPAFDCQLFVDWRQSPVTALPLQHNPRGNATGPLFARTDYPGAVRGLEQVIVLPINELWQDQHVDQVAQVIGQETRVLTHA